MTANLPIIPDPEPASLGPKMRSLSPHMRRFVMCLLEHGGDNYTRAAIAAGYATSGAAAVGSRLAHDERIQDAMEEEARKRLKSGALLATSVLLDTIRNPTVQTKDKLKAIDMVLNRVGLHPLTEHKVTHEHTVDDADLIAKVKRLSGELGLDAQKLLGNAGVIEGEFKEVSNAPLPAGLEGLEDVL